MRGCLTTYAYSCAFTDNIGDVQTFLNYRPRGDL